MTGTTAGLRPANGTNGSSLRPFSPYATLPTMTYPPRITNTGPNAASTVSNSVLYPVWMLAPDNVTKIPNTHTVWEWRGYATQNLTLIQPGATGGPYQFPYRAADPNSFNVGPNWIDFWTDGTDVEFSYLSGLASLCRVYIDDPMGPNGAGLKAVTAAPETLTSTGGNLYRHRYRFGLDTQAPPTLGQTTGGTLSRAVYRYRITAVDANGGETVSSTQASITVIAPNNSVTLSWVAAANTVAGNADRTVASYNIYRTIAGGTGNEQFIANVVAPTVTYTDVGVAEGGAANLRNFSATSGRRLRRVLIEDHFMYFGGITLNLVDSVYPSPPAEDRVLYIGDSLTAGTAAGFNAFGYAPQSSQRLGFTDPDVFGLGGTGYIAANVPQGTGPFIQRLPDVLYTPTLIITAGGRNDVGNTPSAITAAVTAYLAAVKAKWPSVPHVVISPWYSADVDVTTVGAAVKAACDAALPPIPYVDLLAAGTIRGTGTVTVPTGNGNADIVMSTDRVHWTKNGHTAVAESVAETVRGVINGIL